MDATLKNINASRGERTIKSIYEEMEIPKQSFYRKCHTRFSKSELRYLSELLGVEFE